MDEKRDSNNVIFVLVNQLTPIVHNKLIKTKMDIADLAEIIFNVIISYEGFF